MAIKHLSLMRHDKRHDSDPFIFCDSPICRYCANYYLQGEEGFDSAICQTCMETNYWLEFIGIECNRTMED